MGHTTQDNMIRLRIIYRRPCQHHKKSGKKWKKRTLARHVLGTKRFMPARSPNPSKKHPKRSGQSHHPPKSSPPESATRVDDSLSQFFPSLYCFICAIQTELFLAMDLYPWLGWPPKASQSAVALRQLSFSFAILWAALATASLHLA